MDFIVGQKLTLYGNSAQDFAKYTVTAVDGSRVTVVNDDGKSAPVVFDASTVRGHMTPPVADSSVSSTGNGVAIGLAAAAAVAFFLYTRRR